MRTLLPDKLHSAPMGLVSCRADSRRKVEFLFLQRQHVPFIIAFMPALGGLGCARLNVRYRSRHTSCKQTRLYVLRTGLASVWLAEHKLVSAGHDVRAGSSSPTLLTAGTSRHGCLHGDTRFVALGVSVDSGRG